jgi:hypothetical protein
MNTKIITDTTNFFSIDYGDILLIGNRRYVVKGHEHERRFGMSDPKYWVKKAVDQETGERKLIKLSFFETFDMQLGGVKIKCFRNPDKEGKIIELVRDHPSFMQGMAHKDSADNIIRVLDLVRGENFFQYIESLEVDHEVYFHRFLPTLLKKVLKACEAIRFLHVHGHKHGDIRNDHMIMEKETGNLVWIDFDYDYEADENPFGLDIYGLGNILLYSMGKGFHSLNRIEKDIDYYGDLKDRIDPDDFSILHKWKFLNLRKIYPYIPIPLNDILAHFSVGAEMFYESVDEIMEDLNRCIHSFF